MVGHIYSSRRLAFHMALIPRYGLDPPRYVPQPPPHITSKVLGSHFPLQVTNPTGTRRVALFEIERGIMYLRERPLGFLAQEDSVVHIITKMTG
jgi:hypothetical protein